VLRVQEHIGDCPTFDDHAGVHDRDLVADPTDHVHFMGDQDDGQLQLAVDLGQQLQHRGGGLRVEGAGGLVAKEDFRLGGQGTGDTDPLLLPAGELRRVLARVLGEADPFEQFGHPLIDLSTGQLAGQPQRHRHIVGHGLRCQQIEVLEDHPDPLAKAP
jgi:hypothetical protein